MSSAVAIEMVQLEVKGSDPKLSRHALPAPVKGKPHCVRPVCSVTGAQRKTGTHPKIINQKK